MSDAIVTAYISVPAEYVIMVPVLYGELEAQAKLAICENLKANILPDSVLVLTTLTYSSTKVVTSRWYVPEKTGAERTDGWVNAVSQDIARRYRDVLKRHKCNPSSIVVIGKLDSNRYVQGIA